MNGQQRMQYLLIAGAMACLQGHAEAVPTAETDTPDMAQVIVTARRQEENLQKIPMSVSVVDTGMLERANMTTVKDIQYLSPSLNVSSNTTRNSDNYTLRGQGTTFGTDPAVVAYFAEVPVAGGGGGPGMLFDLANVQVLNGPQGTLFGRNTTGGALLFQPQRPTNRMEGAIEAGYGNYNNFQQQGFANIPLIADTLSFRASFSHRKRDGFTTDTVSGAEYDNIEYTAVRLSLLATPFDHFQNYTILNFSDRDDLGPGTKLSSINPAGALAFIFGNAATAAVERQAAIGPRRTTLSVPQREHQKVLLAVNTTKVDIAPTMSIKNIVSYTRFRSDVTFDVDGSALPIVDYHNTPGWGGPQNNSAPAINQVTEELQLSGKPFDGALDGAAGLYFQHNQPVAALTAQQVFGGPINLSRIGDELTSRALFVQGTVDFGKAGWGADGLKLTLGYRITRDRRQDFTETYLQSGNSFDTGGACLYVTGNFPNCRVDFPARTFRKGTYTAALNYDLTPDTMIYGTARSGFKSGGFNLGAPPVSNLNSFNPEEVNDLEVGIKNQGELVGVGIRSSLAVFYDKYHDIQRALVADFGGGAGVYVVNATRATIKGIELQSDIRLTRELRLGVRYSYLKTSYGSFVSPQGDFTGMPLPYTPKNKLALLANYDRDLGGNIGTLGLSATYAHQSSYRNLDAFDPDIEIEGYGLLSLGASWNGILGSRFDASLYATNVTDKLYRIGGGNYYYTLGFTTSIYGEPRMVGFNLTYGFSD